MDLATLIYDVTSDFPKHELYGLSSQMRRAAVSIASNVAEGSARNTKRDFRQFVAMARGSHAELQTQFILAQRLNYISDQKGRSCERVMAEVGRMLKGLARSLDERSA